MVVVHQEVFHQSMLFITSVTYIDNTNNIRTNTKVVIGQRDRELFLQPGSQFASTGALAPHSLLSATPTSSTDSLQRRWRHRLFVALWIIFARGSSASTLLSTLTNSRHLPYTALSIWDALSWPNIDFRLFNTALTWELNTPSTHPLLSSCIQFEPFLLSNHNNNVRCWFRWSRSRGT